jgi:hypothetical protein
MTDPFVIHDVQQSDQPVFAPNGTIQLMRVVTYYVGPHGPFRLQIPKDQATGDYINAQMNQEVVLLRNSSGGQ